MSDPSDTESRRGDVAAVLEMMKSPVGLGLTASPEDAYLLSDAVRCYTHGGDVGAVFCAHASCERDLAASVQASGGAPARAKMWGLGALVDHLEEADALPSDLVTRLRDLNEARKTLYHYGHSESEDALMHRTSRLIAERGGATVRAELAEQRGAAGDNKDVWLFAIELTLRQIALEAVTTGLLLRSWIAENEYGL